MESARISPLVFARPDLSEDSRSERSEHGKPPGDTRWVVSDFAGHSTVWRFGQVRLPATGTSGQLIHFRGSRVSRQVDRVGNFPERRLPSRTGPGGTIRVTGHRRLSSFLLVGTLAVSMSS